MIAQKIQYAINDTELFHLTGCLSKCDKYHYVAHPRTELKEKDNKTPGPSFQISFRIPNGQNEVKEQVECDLRYYSLSVLMPTELF